MEGSLIRLNYGARPKVHLWLDASVNSLAAGLKFIATFRLATFTINDNCVAVSSTNIIMAAEQRKLLGTFTFISFLSITCCSPFTSPNNLQLTHHRAAHGRLGLHTLSPTLHQIGRAHV